jgi:hypothetical protein
VRLTQPSGKKTRKMYSLFFVSSLLHIIGCTVCSTILRSGVKKFDYSFLEKGMLPAGLVNVVSTISELRARESQPKQCAAQP